MTRINSNSRSATRRRPRRGASLLAAGAAAAFLALPTAAQEPVNYTEENVEDSTYYSYVYTLDGSATLFASQSDAQHEVETNLPVLEGDRLWTDRGSRLSVFLSDGSLVSTDSETDLVLQSVLGSPDSASTETVLRLLSGRALLFVDSENTRLPIVDTGNSRVYVQSSGTYVISANGSDWTQVIAREGFAEVVDQRGSSLVRTGEEIEVRGERRPESRVTQASRVTPLEDWALTQSDPTLLASDTSLEQPIYSTATLEEHGDWLEVGGTRAWRPRVANDWRPYWNGRWSHTPRGLYWVSGDPWGPSVYQYGNWDFNNRFGWLWYPGYNFAPSHVYWYWGPSYTAWIPTGFYTNFYRNRFGFGLGFGGFGGFGFGRAGFGRYGFGGLGFGRGFGFRAGHYGWGGGFWDPFDNWIFCPTRYFGYRGQRRYLDYGQRLRRRGGRLERGFITTDTRRITPDRWNRPDLVRRAFDDDLRRRGGLRTADLPEVNDFLARKQLSEPVRQRVLATNGTTPTLGRRNRAANAADMLATPRSGTRSVQPRTAGRSDALRARRSNDALQSRGTAQRRDATGDSTARRVLDGVRTRRSATPGTAPRTASPRSATPRSARPRSASPRTATPRAAAPRSATPRAATPRSASPRSASPRATPRSAAPRSAAPRSRTAVPQSRNRPQASPRVTTPRRTAPPTVRRSTPPAARRSTPQARPSTRPPAGRRSTPPAARRSTPQTRPSTRPPAVRRSTPPAARRSTPQARPSTRPPAVRRSTPRARPTTRPPAA
ncbi:MAG: DUF6600 domain-containing protein, partial [Acidobacteriota bacterium]